MFNYAEINENGICIGVKQVPFPIEDTNHIQLTDYDQSYLGQSYDPENKTWLAQIEEES